ncbi:cysteine--tRNA ligase [Nonomuraea sp. MG754425]|uniref:cysteine--tRNA ligase n=1 Tax=Nonomuraea sp. MG754425 TaxID=2570319 RepID=UPI001F02BEE0|nr:cysteine--tRNA ligase [Nonomuraea sp. MG754425]MCF6471660.1 cysteine--tRNA ligase [Nonomuraea sp. MG754425]
MTNGVTPRLFNSLGRTPIDFRPAVPGRVTIYSCGPTVYSDPHLGNMRPYVFSDTLRRLFEWKGLEVVQAVNITDVGHMVGDTDLGEDKVELAARQQDRSVWEVTRHYTDRYFADLAELNVLPHTHSPRASDYVPQMIDFIKVLEERGFTYQVESGVYFDTGRSKDYGLLALKALDSESDVARLEIVPGKRSRADFAVWRGERREQQRLVHWDSPWGPGVPGWHLECSVMSRQLLGDVFDIHTGGVDHREIHHVNEIAQSTAFLDVQHARDWVPLWMHNEFMLFGQQKMAKSRGRMPVLRDVIDAGHHPLVFRYFLLNAHYRSQMDISDDGLRSASAALRRLLGRVAPLRPLPAPATFAAACAALTTEAGRTALRQVDAAVSDDLNTPRVLAELNGVLRDDALADTDKAIVVAAVDVLLGLRLSTLSPDDLTAKGELSISEDLINELVAARTAARGAGDWAQADRIRAQLTELGVRVVDTPAGPRWEPVAADPQH